MKAMILAAGLGTRLRPLTAEKPKALIPVVNRPIISRNIDYLTTHGFDDIIVNTHHHFQQILDYLDGGTPFGVNIDVRVEPEILGTGGGIKNCSDFLDGESFIVINSDILTDISLERAYDNHKRSGSIATLVLHNCEPFNQIRIDNHSRVVDIASQKGRDRLAFTGIHIMEPDILSHIHKSGYSDIIDCYKGLISAGVPINAYISERHYWHDIGNIESYISASGAILKLDDEPFVIGPCSYMDPSVRLEEWAIVGEKSCLEKGAELKRSILWDNVRVKTGTRIKDSIVTSFNEVTSDLNKEIF
ncbi:sugar phosphate nucleotidyltransferase [Thermodesulfobacteriota bacterium]